MTDRSAAVNSEIPLIVKAINVCKSFKQGSEEVRVLEDMNISITAGQSIAIVGASGAGKSTLLNILGGLDNQYTGELLVQGTLIKALTDSQLSEFRNNCLGFVYQFHHLLPEFTALENVAMPELIANASRSEALDRAEAVLSQLGMSHRLKHRPDQLSGGERQRVAIARAMIRRPALILMDEPTGNLDKESANSVLALIDELSATSNSTFVVVTHDQDIAKLLDKAYLLTNGNLLPVKE